MERKSCTNVITRVPVMERQRGRVKEKMWREKQAKEPERSEGAMLLALNMEKGS